MHKLIVCYLFDWRRMKTSRMGQWLSVLICVVLLLKAEGVPVGITFVENAVAKGAGEKFLL